MFVLRITTSTHSSSAGFTLDRLRMAEQAHDGALDPDAPQHPPLNAPIQPAQKHTQVPGENLSPRAA